MYPCGHYVVTILKWVPIFDQYTKKTSTMHFGKGEWQGHKVWALIKSLFHNSKAIVVPKFQLGRMFDDQMFEWHQKDKCYNVIGLCAPNMNVMI